jgi:hypothetical protein
VGPAKGLPFSGSALLAKNVFQFHGINENGKVILKKKFVLN